MIDDAISRTEEASGKASLIGWQFAADGKWDVAERVFLDMSAETEAQKQVEAWLQKQTTDNIAFEALFQLSNRERFFFGVRISHLEPEEKSGLIQSLLVGRDNGGQGMVSPRTLFPVVEQMRRALGDDQLAKTTPDYLELGVFDLWNRVKSLVVWKNDKDATIILPEAMAGKTQKPDDGFPALHEPQNKPLMLEAAWKRDVQAGKDFQCWISLPVSEFGKTPNRYSISRNRYLSAATTFTALLQR